MKPTEQELQAKWEQLFGDLDRHELFDLIHHQPELFCEFPESWTGIKPKVVLPLIPLDFDGEILGELPPGLHPDFDGEFLATLPVPEKLKQALLVRLRKNNANK